MSVGQRARDRYLQNLSSPTSVNHASKLTSSLPRSLVSSRGAFNTSNKSTNKSTKPCKAEKPPSEKIAAVKAKFENLAENLTDNAASPIREVKSLAENTEIHLEDFENTLKTKNLMKGYDADNEEIDINTFDDLESEDSDADIDNLIEEFNKKANITEYINDEKHDFGEDMGIGKTEHDKDAAEQMYATLDSFDAALESSQESQNNNVVNENSQINEAELNRIAEEVVNNAIRGALEKEFNRSFNVGIIDWGGDSNDDPNTGINDREKGLVIEKDENSTEDFDKKLSAEISNDNLLDIEKFEKNMSVGSKDVAIGGELDDCFGPGKEEDEEELCDAYKQVLCLATEAEEHEEMDEVEYVPHLPTSQVPEIIESSARGDYSDSNDGEQRLEEVFDDKAEVIQHSNIIKGFAPLSEEPEKQEEEPIARNMNTTQASFNSHCIYPPFNWLINHLL